ncbi:MAG: HAMP domain-containing protein [Burkholderiaceae bacterium]|nr:HAMP domain-containing protein [Sulfuritalea sp.]MCF8176216.1 HAMP domain-containing protein [Burkholderiaceae bacterium]
MHLNIAHKIFGTATVVLALMTVVAVYSLHLAGRISDELDTVVGKHLILSHALARMNIQVLEQEGLMQRLFDPTQDNPKTRARIETLSNEIDDTFLQIRTRLRTREQSTHLHQVSQSLELSLDTVEREYREFQTQLQTLLTHHNASDKASFVKVLPTLLVEEDDIDNEIITSRLQIEALTDAAVLRADGDEKFLLSINAGLTALAAALGLGFAAIVTNALVRNVRNLVVGAKAVEAGDLDTEVAVMTQDEIGTLTGSFNGMVGGLRMKERIRDTFGKYMDPRIVGNLLEHPEFTEPGGERREMTIMFIDLKGFTSIAERLAPDALVRMVNGFFTRMTHAISINAGVVDKFIGDAVMAYWGPPFCGPGEHAELACKAALAALDQLDRLRADVAAELGTDVAGLEFDVDLRIGIATGEVIVGSVGSPAQKNFTVMGDPVNLASRLEGASKAYGTRILLSERTQVVAGRAVNTREIDLIRVKGKLAPTRIFELLPLPGEGTDRFALGLAAYRSQNWDLAEKAFAECQTFCPEDPPSRVYLDRIAQLRATPPVPGWDGVWVFETK